LSGGRFLWNTFLLLGVGGCAVNAPHATASLPPGIVLLGQASSLAAFLDEVARIDGTPIAAFADAERARVGACTGRAALVVPSGDLAADPARRWFCGADAMPSAFVDLGPEEFVVVLPGVGRRSYARIRVGGPSAAHEVLIDVAPDESTLLALLAPKDAELRPDRLPRAGSILHAHLATAGRLPVPETSSAEIRAGASALFDGSWEAALLGPITGDSTPAPVVALGLRSDGLGTRALETVADLASRPFGGRTRVVRIAEGVDAKCLAERAIVLGFAPCAAVYRGALVAAWHQGALERVLAADAATTSGGITIDFDAMAAADAFLKDAAPGASILAPRMPWRRLSLEAKRSGVLTGVLEVRP
jgi:hypothetical protein